MPSFPIDELSALKLVFSNTTVKDMIAAAQVGYNDLASTDKTSSCSEMADVWCLCIDVIKVISMQTENSCEQVGSLRRQVLR